MMATKTMNNPAKQPDLVTLWSALETHYPGRSRRNEPLANHTTLRLGGPADIWFPARSVEELVTVSGLAHQHGCSLFLLGGGANILVGDGGRRGLVIENRASAVRFQESRVLAESGAVTPRLARQCAQQGLSGLEWAVGVPGTIGGATVNNAGAYGASMADVLLRAELLDEGGERFWQPRAWFDYAYRSSRLKRQTARQLIILQVELALTQAPPAEIEARMRKINERRKASQPPGATIGSMFKNPPGDYAGRLIEAAGLKGYRLGQAQISPAHANFFVNLGQAQASDVIALIDLARQTVQAQFGIELELEIELVGER